MNSIHKGIRFALVGVLLLGASAVYAQATTQVTSLTLAASTIDPGYTTLLTWQTDSTSAVKIYVTCPIGVIAKYGDGTALTCNSLQALSPDPVGSVSVKFSNVSGTPKTVQIRVTPVDLNGVVSSSGSKDVSLTVNALSQPIVDFTTSSNTVASGGNVDLRWQANEIPGVNLEFVCPGSIHIVGVTPLGSIRCNGLAYGSDQQQSGSVTVRLTNDDIIPATVTVDVLPAIVSGSYDALHKRTLTIQVAGKGAESLPANITSFDASTHSPVSGQPVTLSWNVGNASGVNLQFNCSSSLSVSAVTGGATTSLPCGTPAFATSLSPVGNTTVVITNTDYFSQTLQLQLLPALASGGFDGTHAGSLTLAVAPKGSVPVASTPTTPTTPTTTPVVSAAVPVPAPVPSAVVSPASTSASRIRAVHAVLFSAALQRGSRGGQVTALQKFLSEDPSLYPEAAVTGFFGPATERAVQKFQVRFGIAKAGVEGYGGVGPKTRAKLNALDYF